MSNKHFVEKGGGKIPPSFFRSQESRGEAFGPRHFAPERVKVSWAKGSASGLWGYEKRMAAFSRHPFL